VTGPLGLDAMSVKTVGAKGEGKSGTCSRGSCPGRVAPLRPRVVRIAGAAAGLGMKAPEAVAAVVAGGAAEGGRLGAALGGSPDMRRMGAVWYAKRYTLHQLLRAWRGGSCYFARGAAVDFGDLPRGQLLVDNQLSRGRAGSRAERKGRGESDS
jgi:hypothetical protein